MKKVANQTARVYWHMGQALLPEHFYAQEESLREEANLRFGMQPAPAWGLGTLSWDGFQLPKGIISVQEMTIVFRSGALLDIPGNAAPAVLSLSASTGATRAPIYAHLQSDYDKVSVARGDAAEEGIERVIQKVELSSNMYSETKAQTFKLAEVECGPDGVWSLCKDYIPPLLQIGESPFFDDQLRRMRAIVLALRQTVVSEIQENHLSGESQASAKQCLRGIFAMKEVLTDLDHGIRLHPFDLFRAIRRLYVDVCVYRNVDPSEIERAYDHEDLAGCFGVLLEKLEEQAQIGRQVVPYVGFSRKEGMLECELGRDVKRAKDVFFLIQKPQVSGRLDLAGVKMASPSRLHAVYERALRGIPFTRVENLPFHHGLSSNVEFYALSPGQEWDYAIREGKVVLFDGPQLAGTRLYLYWRTD